MSQSQKLEEYLSRRLESFEPCGWPSAGQTVARYHNRWEKVPLGIWLGSTENSRVCTAMLQDLLERGLRVDESIL